MAQPSIVVIDYGAGNIRSVERALAHIGVASRVTDDPAVLRDADGVILPGVGAAHDTMDNLRSRGLVDPVKEFIASGRPFMGVCMGLHALFDRSEEDGGEDCLGVLPGVIRRFQGEGLKIPHMGWNTVEWVRDHPITENVPGGSYFYFVHSYHPAPADPALAVGETTYGDITFPSVVARDNVVATQFHPEKSGEDGLVLYANFARWVGERPVVQPTEARS